MSDSSPTYSVPANTPLRASPIECYGIQGMNVGQNGTTRQLPSGEIGLSRRAYPKQQCTRAYAAKGLAHFRCKDFNQKIWKNLNEFENRFGGHQFKPLFNLYESGRKPIFWRKLISIKQHA